MSCFVVQTIERRVLFGRYQVLHQHNKKLVPESLALASRLNLLHSCHAFGFTTMESFKLGRDLKNPVLNS